MKKTFNVSVSILIILISLISSSLFSIPSTAFSKKSFGVQNAGNSFIKRLSKKFGLVEKERKIKINEKNKKSRFYTLKEYINFKTHLIVWFQKDFNKPAGKVLNTVYILSANKKQALLVANFFVFSLKVRKKYKKRWNRYLSKVSFKAKPTQYFEYGGVPGLRCITHKIYHKNQKKNAFYLEISILN